MYIKYLFFLLNSDTRKFMKMNGRNLHLNERFVVDARITVKVLYLLSWSSSPQIKLKPYKVIVCTSFFSAYTCTIFFKIVCNSFFLAYFGYLSCVQFF
jgi:hypothetical protein